MRESRELPTVALLLSVIVITLLAFNRPAAAADAPQCYPLEWFLEEVAKEGDPDIWSREVAQRVANELPFLVGAADWPLAGAVVTRTAKDIIFAPMLAEFSVSYTPDGARQVHVSNRPMVCTPKRIEPADWRRVQRVAFGVDI